MSLSKLVNLAKEVLTKSNYTGLDPFIKGSDAAKEKTEDTQLEKAILALNTKLSDELSEAIVPILQALVKYKQDPKSKKKEVEHLVAAFESTHGETSLRSLISASPNNKFIKEAREFIETISVSSEQYVEVTKVIAKKAEKDFNKKKQKNRKKGALELKAQITPTQTAKETPPNFIAYLAECRTLEFKLQKSYSGCSAASQAEIKSAYLELKDIFKKTLKNDIADQKIVPVKLKDIKYKPDTSYSELSFPFFSSPKPQPGAADKARDEFYAVAIKMTEHFNSEKMIALRKMAIAGVSEDMLDALILMADEMQKQTLAERALQQLVAAQQPELARSSPL